MLVLALDVGTSSARARVYDERGRARPGAEGHVVYEPRTTPDGGVELDANSLIDAVARAIDECLAGCGKPARDIAGVGASVFWHSLLGLDGSGRALIPVLTWADTRSAAAAQTLRRELDEGAVHQRTGAPIHSTFFPAKLRWLRETQPEVFRRAARWCGFAELLQARLTGSLQCSLSMASGTGLLDQERGGWDRAMLEAAGISADALPPIDDEAAPGLIAPWSERWPALARVPWYPAHGDGACSNIGSGCSGPDRIALNVGTSAALRVVLPEGLGAHRATPAGLWRYRVDGRRALVGGATSEGGNVLAWCRKTLALPAGDAALEQALAAVPPDGHGLTALPFLASAAQAGGPRRAPRWPSCRWPRMPWRSPVRCSRRWRSGWPRSTTGCVLSPPPTTGWSARAAPSGTLPPGHRSSRTRSACRSGWARTRRPPPGEPPCSRSKRSGSRPPRRPIRPGSCARTRPIMRGTGRPVRGSYGSTTTLSAFRTPERIDAAGPCESRSAATTPAFRSKNPW
jgi:gluconokinase